MSQNQEVPKGLPSESAEELKNRGNEFYNQGQYEEAVEWYTKSLAKGQSVAAYNNRALTLLKLNRHREAFWDSTMVIEVEPRNVKAHCRKILAFKERGQHFRGVINLLDSQEVNNEALKKLGEEMVHAIEDRQPDGSCTNYYDLISTADRPIIFLYQTSPQSILLESAPLKEHVKPLKNWVEMKEHLLSHSGLFRFSSITLTGDKIAFGEDAIECFRQLSSTNCFKDIYLIFRQIDFTSISKQLLNEFFDEMVKPHSLCINEVKGFTGHDLLNAIHTLEAFRYADDVKFYQTGTLEDEELFDIDEFIDCFHTLPVNRQPKRFYTEVMLFTIPITEIVKKFLERFYNANSRTSYFLTIVCPKEQLISMPSIQLRYYNAATNERFSVGMCNLEPFCVTALTNRGVSPNDFLELFIRRGL